MANIKISELTALTPPDAADLVPVTDSSASQTKRTTVGEIVGIVNGDVDVANDGTATISELPVSKLQDGDARQLLQTDAAGTGVEWTSNVDVPGTLDVTGATTLDSTLGVTGQSTLASAAVSDLTSGRVVLAGTSGELEDSAALTFNGTQLDVDGDVVITGDLTVEGASTILETETVKVEDKNIELGVVASPTDVTADGGGITLKGTTDKTLNWVDATDSWTSSEHVDLASGKSYRINGTEVLSATALGSAVQISSANIPNGTIVDADVNASAAIAGTKISPDFGSQDVVTTGTSTAASFIPTSSTVPTNGVYLPAANTVALSVNGSEGVRLTTTGLGIGSSAPGATLHVEGLGNTVNQRIFTSDNVLNATASLTFGTTPGFRSKAAIRMINTNTGNSQGALSLLTDNGLSGLIDRLYISGAGDVGVVGAGTGGVNYAASFSGSAPVNSLNLDSSGRLLVGTSSDSGGALLQVNGDRVRIATAKTPASATDTGTAGEVCWDANYVYVCTAANTWKRTAIATW